MDKQKTCAQTVLIVCELDFGFLIFSILIKSKSPLCDTISCNCCQNNLCHEIKVVGAVKEFTAQIHKMK